MKTATAKICLAAGSAFFFLALASDRAQPIPVGHATGFTSSQYFEAPNEQKVKMKLTAVEALPLPGGLLDVKILKVETFNLAGKSELVVLAPQCNYSPVEGVANSAGHLELQSGEGKIHVEGEGFWWNQRDNSLAISNNVYTLIKTGVWKMTMP